MSSSAQSVATLACPVCNHVRTLDELAHDPVCACGAPNYIHYDCDRDLVALQPQDVNVASSAAGLEKRLEILSSNLAALDPLSTWTGEPKMKWGFPLTLITVGAILALLGGAGSEQIAAAGAFLVLAGAGLAAYFWSTVEPAIQVYRRDRATSIRNQDTAGRLRAQIGWYELLLSALLSQQERS